MPDSDGEHRVACPHAERCPGCPLIGLAYGAGLEKKAALLTAALAAYPALGSAALGEFEKAPDIEGYRLRAKLVRGASALGLFRHGSHEVVDNPDCPVLRPVLRTIANAIRRELASVPRLTSVDLVEADAGALVTLGGPRDAAIELEHFARDVVAKFDGVVGVALSVREPGAARVIGSTPRAIAGSSEARRRLGKSAPFHYVSPGAFTQLHGGQAERLHQLVEAGLDTALAQGIGAVRVLELYGGSGALALRLASRGAHVTMVESFAPAAALAERAAVEQVLELRTVAGDAAETLNKLASARAEFDAVVANPPRRGLSPSVRRPLAALAPACFAYVSCEPATLARDADHLARLGLVLVRAQPLDMIPLSESVETLAWFAPGPAPPPRVLHWDDQLVAVEKAAHEPSIPQGEHRDSLLERVRRLDGCRDAVPVHRLDLGTSGVTLFARRPEHVAELSRALAAGEKEYVALVRGITRKKGNVRRPLADARRGPTARPAQTNYTRERVVSGHSLVVVRPLSGRTHQVRRHLAGLGHPVLGDERYGDRASNAHFEHRHGLDRSFLHLARVTITHRSRELTLDCRLPGDLTSTLASLERITS